MRMSPTPWSLCGSIDVRSSWMARVSIPPRLGAPAAAGLAAGALVVAAAWAAGYRASTLKTRPPSSKRSNVCSADEVGEPGHRPGLGGRRAHRRQHVPGDREEQHQQQARDEWRYRQAEQRSGHAAQVDPRVTAYGGQDAQRVAIRTVRPIAPTTN